MADSQSLPVTADEGAVQTLSNVEESAKDDDSKEEKNGTLDTKGGQSHQLQQPSSPSSVAEADLAMLKSRHALQEELNASRLRDLTSANNELKGRVAGLVADLESRSKELEESRRHHAEQSGKSEAKHQQLTDDLEQALTSIREKEQAGEKQRSEWEAERKHHHAELAAARQDLQSRSTEHEKQLNSTQSDLTGQLEKMEGDKNKAASEIKALKELLDAKENERQAAIAEKAKAERLMQNFRQESEKLKSQVQTLECDVLKWQTNYESVQTLLNDTQKQTERSKDDLKSQFIKISWAQNKLKAETEAHKATKSKLETTSTQLESVRAEIETMRKDHDRSMTDVQSQSVRSSTQLDSRIKELEVDIKKRVEEATVERQAHKVTAQQLLDTQNQLKDVIEEADSTKTLLEEKTAEIVELQQNVSKEHDRYEETQRECERLNSRIGEIGELRQQLTQERARVATLSSELGEVLTSRSELEGEVGERQQREGEMLSFHQRMASLNAELQSQHTKLSDDVLSLRNSTSDLKIERDRLKEDRDRLNRELENLKLQYSTEVTSLSQKVDDKTKAVEQLTVLLEDERGEVRVLKRKNAASVKDLTRQLLQTRKTVDAIKTGDLDIDEFRQQSSSVSGGRSTTMSRYGSDNDLSTSPSAFSTEVAVGSPENGQGMLSDSRERSISPPRLRPSRSRSIDCGRGDSAWQPEQKPLRQDSPEKSRSRSLRSDDGVSIARPPATVEKERRLLLNKIGSLQNAHASKDEKMVFLESHIAELTEEIRRKTKVIQCLVLRQDSGSISPASIDTYKLQAGPQRGVMASVFHSRKADQKLTLGLSLEINSKMQAVLEDLLVKNMTLKDNLATLGQEVADLLTVIKNHNIRVPRKFRS